MVMLMCALSLVMTVVVLNLHHRSPEMYEMPNWVRDVSSGFQNRFVSSTLIYNASVARVLDAAVRSGPMGISS